MNKGFILLLAVCCLVLVAGCKSGGGSAQGTQSLASTGGEQIPQDPVVPHQPEPATILLFGLGALGLFGLKKRKK